MYFNFMVFLVILLNNIKFAISLDRYWNSGGGFRGELYFPSIWIVNMSNQVREISCLFEFPSL